MSVPDFPIGWKVSDPVLIAETFSSRIWKVRLRDGAPGIVKALKPFDDVEDELRGAHLLRWRRGTGMVRLLGLDGRNMLLEYAGETHLTEHLDGHGDRAATEIAAEVMAKLFSPSRHPAPLELQPLRDRFHSLFRRAQADRDADAASVYVEAASVAQRLLDDQKSVRPLHGDLHHDNIVHGPRGWLAIDPKGVIGDTAFDAANMFYNPIDRDSLCNDAARVAVMADMFSQTLKLDQGRLLDFAFAYGCLSAAWHGEDGNRAEEDRELSIARTIQSVR